MDPGRLSEAAVVLPLRARRVALAYLGMLAAAGAAFWLIRSLGQGLVAPAIEVQSRAPLSRGSVGADAILHVLLALAAVIVLGQILGRMFSYIGQPRVIGEVVAGILLGPSLLGRLAPAVSGYLLPDSVAPFLGVISQFGVILYMFMVGLELDPGKLRERASATLLIAHASILVPFIGGAALALGLYPHVSSREVPFTSFALFVGVSMAVTAFPVLARILADRGTQHTRLGSMALACAAIDDVTAWCLLAVVVAVFQANPASAFRVASLTIVYIALMFGVARPMVARLLPRLERSAGTTSIAVLFVALMLSAAATELIGIHAIFGAFLLGAIMPRDSALARSFLHKLEDLVSVVLLPAFFAFTGMRTQIGLLNSAEQWAWCALITVVATAGKFGGASVAARLVGESWRESAAVGTLMNTRGLMELIVLNVGLDLGVISPSLFAMMVLMALVTTLTTGPVLSLISPTSMKSPETVTAEHALTPANAVR